MKQKSNVNGKGDSPRNNTSKKFKDNYTKINWKKMRDTKKNLDKISEKYYPINSCYPVSLMYVQIS